MTPTNVISSIGSITRKYGKVVANSIEVALNTLSVCTSIINMKPVYTRVDITTGIHLL